MTYNADLMRFWKVAAFLLAACASVLPPQDQPIPADWLSVPQAVRYPELSYEGGILAYKAISRSEAPLHIVKTATGAKLSNGDKDLTPELRAIDSFDLSEHRKEIVFSAKRSDNFDVGLVALEGSDIHWIPSDPADEVGAQWMANSNRINYILRTPNGDLARTVLVTTSGQSTVEFPNGRIVARAWHPNGEKFAVSWETFDASQRVETMDYDGKDRHMTASPTARLTGFASEISNGALIVRPEEMHYGEKLPLVVWRTSDRNRWSDARAKLQRESRVAVAIVEHDPDDAFWSDMRLHPWVDLTRVFVVNAPAPASATSIRGSSNVAAGHYRVEGNTMLVPVDVVESFAAGLIAHQLKGSPPANGPKR
jgi:hypothetical protein